MNEYAIKIKFTDGSEFKTFVIADNAEDAESWARKRYSKVSEVIVSPTGE